MDLEEEIAWKIRNDCNMYIRQGRKIAHVIMPLVKRAQAEAWSKGFRAERYKSNLNGDYLGATRNPYTETENEAGA